MWNQLIILANKRHTQRSVLLKHIREQLTNGYTKITYPGPDQTYFINSSDKSLKVAIEIYESELSKVDEMYNLKKTMVLLNRDSREFSDSMVGGAIDEDMWAFQENAFGLDALLQREEKAK